MKRIEEKYKKYCDNISTTNNLDQKIFNKTIYKKPTNLIFKKVFAPLTLIICLSFVSVCIVFADEIKEAFKVYWKTQQVPNSDKEDLLQTIKDLYVTNLKEINYDADLNEVSYFGEEKINILELEKKLNIKFLSSNMIRNDEVTIFKLTKENNKISNAEFVIKDAFQISNMNKNNVYMKFQFITKYYEDKEKGFILIRDYMPYGTEGWITKKHINNLNTDVYFHGDIQNLEDNYISSWLKAYFVYDNVGYTVGGYDISINDLKKILESFTK